MGRTGTDANSAGSARAPVVVCTGIVTVDQIFELDELPVGEGKYSARTHREVGGGVAANAAVAIARLGGRTSLIGCIGDDEFGHRALTELDADGVGTDRCQRIPGRPTPTSVVLVARDGTRTVVNHVAADFFALADPAPAGRIAPAEAVLVDCRWLAGAQASLAAAHRVGIPGVVDVDRPLPPGDEAAIFELATHLVFSRAGLTGITGSEHLGDALRAVARRTAAWPAVTDGAEGVLWLERDRLHHQPAHHVAAVDTAGAGDTFHGAFVLGLAEGMPEGRAVRFASAAAAAKCTRPGGRAGIPHRAEVESLLAAAGVVAS